MMAKILGERLKALRAAKNRTQQAVCDELQWKRTMLQRYESGERLPQTLQLIALADYYDVSTDYLLGRTDDPARH